MEKTARGEASKTNQYEVLVDSDAFIGAVYPEDPHHNRTKRILIDLKRQGVRLVTTSAVVTETATVLSYRKGQDLANFFLKEIIEEGEFPVIFISEELHLNALKLFSKQTKRGTSVTDCANVAVMMRYEIPTIFSFDQGYIKQFNLTLIGDKLEGH